MTAGYGTHQSPRPDRVKNSLYCWAGKTGGSGRYWSRGIDQEHRLVYSITGSGDSQRLCIVQCRFHYK
ncbi:MAG: type II toxin-antitoxin system YoeB family toxin [Flavobacteriales bacterium]|nr:type II toxin-antitoxin system YoeB family toxin [Flavobacteriales bacterium]